MTISHLTRGKGLSLSCCQIRMDGDKATVLSEVQATEAKNFPMAGMRMGTYVHLVLIRLLPFPLQAVLTFFC